jgi:hypothetical protein
MHILNKHFKCQKKSWYYSFTKKHKFSPKTIYKHIVEFVHIVRWDNSSMIVAGTQWTNHNLKELRGKSVQNCVHIPILITFLLDQQAPQPNTHMRQPKVWKDYKNGIK